MGISHLLILESLYTGKDRNARGKFARGILEFVSARELCTPESRFEAEPQFMGSQAEPGNQKKGRFGRCKRKAALIPAGTKNPFLIHNPCR